MLLISFVLLIYISAKVDATVLPLHYSITINPNVHNLSFLGEAIVQVHVEGSVGKITLNSKNLEFSQVQVFDSSSVEITVTTVLLDKVSETITLSFTDQINEGLYDLKFTYSGKINEGKHEGLYKSQYTDQAGVERPFLLTNFQFNHARQVFPCFDHPSLPATYSINIIRPNDYISLSHTPKTAEDELADGKTIDKFARSDTMPTYLVSFAVLDFTRFDYGTKSIFSVVENGTELAVSLFSEVERKFQELYPFKFSKIDYVIVPDYALPEDFFSTVGLILFRQSAVLFDEETNRTEDQQSLLKSIAYTVVKQTNKNEDTSDWWTHFWLNEGILRWYQHEICNVLRPEWRLLEQFIVQDLHETLHYDKNEDALMVTMSENNSPKDSSKHFYVKSFSLIRMFKHQQLPGDITEISENEVVKSWANYKGYPILRTRRNYQTNVITVSQDSTKTISIPFSATTEEMADFDTAESIHTLKETEDQFDISLKDSDDWYIINKQQTGYFRVAYFDEDWWQIINFLQNDDHTKISAINRAELIDDAYNLAFDEVISYYIFLETIKYIEKEEDFVPLYAFFQTTNRLKILLAGSEAYGKFLSHVTRVAQHLYDKVGTEVNSNDGHIIRLRRINVLTWLCNFDHTQCQQKMFDILTKKENVHPDLQEPVYCGGMRLSTIENFEHLLSKYQESKNTKILKYMGCTSDETILRYYLEGILNETLIVHLRPEHALDAFAAVIEGSHEGAQMALVFIKQYLENILQRFDEDLISKVFNILSSRLVDPENLVVIDEMIACLTGDDQTKYFQLFQSAKKSIEKNINWRKKNLNYVNDWLNNNGTTTSTTTSTTSKPTGSPDGAATLTIDLLCVLVFAVTYFTVFCNN